MGTGIPVFRGFSCQKIDEGKLERPKVLNGKDNARWQLSSMTSAKRPRVAGGVAISYFRAYKLREAYKFVCLPWGEAYKPALLLREGV
jgi:hypothetical protein